MLSNHGGGGGGGGGESARAQDGSASQMRPWIDDDGHHKEAPAVASAPSAASKNRDKIRSLDGLRGIACLLVFNYHFLWPWSPGIMLGYGALPPRAPEPWNEWTSLPIICLLQRGRPMVAIFFAISGYVLCRHILRAIHERRIDAAYKSLASSVFRRVFRLYAPPTISMFLVAMLAQVGVFRHEDDIFKGPDSVYINGTFTVGLLPIMPNAKNGPKGGAKEALKEMLSPSLKLGRCANGTYPVTQADAVADYMGVPSTHDLNVTHWPDLLCMNSSSVLLSPAMIYQIVADYEALFHEEEKPAKNKTKKTTKPTSTSVADLSKEKLGKDSTKDSTKDKLTKDDTTDSTTKSSTSSHKHTDDATDPSAIDQTDIALAAKETMKDAVDETGTVLADIAEEAYAEQAAKDKAAKSRISRSQGLTRKKTVSKQKLQEEDDLLTLEIEDEVVNATVRNNTDFKWIQFGGSWEEHPFIHDNITYALQNFTRVYAEWANPFNFGHYHTRYDPHTFTIPMELRGSMVIYIFLLGTAALKYKWRFIFGVCLSAYSLAFGRWDIAAFVGGTTLSEMDIRLASNSPGQGFFEERALAPPATDFARGRYGSFSRSKRGVAVRWFFFFLALHFLSYPDAAAEYTPGFRYLSSWLPRYYIPLAGWCFYQSLGAMILLPCVLRSPLLCRLLEGRLAQYMGRISFSFYLVHGPVLHSLGFWIMPRLFDRFGKLGGYAVGYPILLSISLYIADWWYRKIDVWSATLGRRIERALVY